LQSLRDARVRGAVLSRAISLGGAPITLWLVASHLRTADQGLYFVLLGVVMLAQFMEMGPATILVQFASHEAGRLQWSAGGQLTGGINARTAISVLLHTALRWHARIALLLVAVVGVGGAFVYAPRQDSLAFLVLWFSSILLVAAYIMLVPFLAICEGTGAQISLQNMRAVQAAAVLLALWSGLLQRHALLACWLAAFVQVGIAGRWLVFTRRGLLRAPTTLPSNLAGDQDATLATKLDTEQRRSAQLWFALQFASQLIAPVLLVAQGGDQAGRFGLTLALTTAPVLLAAAWLHARLPGFGALVATQRLVEFDRAASQAVGQMLLVFGVGAVGVLLLPLVLLRWLPVLGVRVLPLPATGAMLSGALALLLLQAMSAWARSFRDEAMRTPVVVACIAIALGGMAGGVLAGATGAALGYGAAGLLGLGPVAVLFTRHRSARLHT